MIKSNIIELAHKYDVFLVDIYGVIFDGHQILKQAKDHLEMLIKQGKYIIFISNTAQLSKEAIHKYNTMGLHQLTHFTSFITAGDLARYSLSTKCNEEIFLSQIFLRNESIFHNLDNVYQTNLDDAKYIYIGVPKINNENIDISALYDNNGQLIPIHLIITHNWKNVFNRYKIPILADVHDLLLKCYISNKILICANPDLFAQEQNIPALRQGLIASYYEKLGGKVLYFGKPFSSIFNYAFHLFPNIRNKKIAMIGDTPWTDISGANMVDEIDSIMTLTGSYNMFLHSNNLKHSKKNLEDFINNFSPHMFSYSKNVIPNIIIESF